MPRYALIAAVLMLGTVLVPPGHGDAAHITLEAESSYIIREVAAEFERPVMLYSIGKDSSVMVRLAQKASTPGRCRSRCST